MTRAARLALALAAVLALTACGATLPAVRSVAPPVVATATVREPVRAPAPPVPNTTAPARTLRDAVIDALCAAPDAPEATVTVDGRRFVALTHPCRAAYLDRAMFWDTYVREDTTLAPRVVAERRPEM